MATRTAARPFSTGWTFLSMGIFLAVELTIGAWVGPVVLGKYVSPMFHLQLQMLMHLVSFYLGGIAVGIVSPGVRLKEPAVGAFLSVLVVFLISFFMPTWVYQFDLDRLLVGGGIAFVLALAGAYTGETWMGNIQADESEAELTTRGRLRSALWNESDGLLHPRDRQRQR